MTRNWNWSSVPEKTLSAMEIVNKIRAAGTQAANHPAGQIGKPANLPPRPAHLKKTLVLDIDETLVRLSFERVPNFDAYLCATSSQDGSWAYVYFRPYVHEFLAICASMYEVVAFTAGNQEYADQVLNALDPKNKFFSARLYREHCFRYEWHNGSDSQSLYVKDLSQLGRDLSEVVLVDNSLVSFAFQLDNGILVNDFDPEKEGMDKGLAYLLPFLKPLNRLPDVRELLRHNFGNEEMMEAFAERGKGSSDVRRVSPVSEVSAGLRPQGQQMQHSSIGVIRTAPNINARDVLPVIRSY